MTHPRDRRSAAGAQSRGPLRRALIVASLLWAVTAVPYLFGCLVTPGNMVYTGLLFNVPDHAQYWAWVTASRAGLFISNTTTPEPNPPVFFNGMAWLLAIVQRAFGLSFPALFQVWRAAACVVLVPAIAIYCRTFTRDEGEGRIAIVIAIAGAGLGWVLVLAKHIAGSADVAWPMDVYIAEANTFWSLLAYPYASLVLGVQVLTLTAVWWAHVTGRWTALALAGGGAAFLSFTHAYDLIIVAAVTGTFGLVEWRATRRFPARLVAAGLAMAACAAPLVAYYVRLTSFDPLWHSVLAQYANAGVWTPAPHHLLVLMGVPLVLAIVGAFVSPPRNAADRYVLTWACVGTGLIYLPVVYQVKMLAGWQLPLAVLAARGWRVQVQPIVERVWSAVASRSRPRRRPVLGVVALALLIAPTNVYLFAWRFVDLARVRSPYYFTRDEADAFDWLAEHATPADVVLAPLATGRLVPGYSGRRTMLAHWAMTNKYFEREAQVARFFSPAVADAWRRWLLEREGVTIVVWTAAAGDAGIYDPSGSAMFERVFTSPGVQVFRVTAGAAAN
ncbi:MAG: hypothetical protein AB7Q29_02700 [Vicinamibacterales bacterium]